MFFIWFSKDFFICRIFCNLFRSNMERKSVIINSCFFVFVYISTNWENLIRLVSMTDFSKSSSRSESYMPISWLSNKLSLFEVWIYELWCFKMISTSSWITWKSLNLKSIIFFDDYGNSFCLNFIPINFSSKKYFLSLSTTLNPTSLRSMLFSTVVYGSPWCIFSSNFIWASRYFETEDSGISCNILS